MQIAKYRVTLVDDFQWDPFTDSARCLGGTNSILVVINIQRHLATQKYYPWKNWTNLKPDVFIFVLFAITMM